MSDFVILSLILFLVVCLILTLAGFVFYSGLLSEIVIRTGSPPVKKITIAYKFIKGSYRDRGAAFTESCSIAPKLCSIALYYDNPNEAEADCCRYAVGSILSHDEEKTDEELQRLYEKFGFRVISFPEVSYAVLSSFPNHCMLSPICGAYRVFPELHSYIAERGLSAYPFIEICKGDIIHYMCPLENQGSFFVPELLEKQTEGEEETKNDKDADDTHTGEGCTSESGVAVMEADTEISEVAESSVLVMQQSPPLDETDSQTEEGDQGAKGSSESVGSGSSFEELDMDIEEVENERENVEEDHVEDNEKRGDDEGESNEG
ncbi:testis-expressed protein 264 homolog [Ictalurus furcatus]|uniref:testis-expressed protein 264 homolog n=1 Tax=Ictalurus furcatus TaxID=66913 RepID=UPI002350904C|nr:testis-expressed protein 264 homolog [Ictalurus furcatus]